jgi:hypothetical protein
MEVTHSTSQQEPDVSRQTLAKVCSHEELVVTLMPASEDQSGAIQKIRNIRHWEPLPGDDLWRHSRLRSLSTCCSEF